MCANKVSRKLISVGNVFFFFARFNILRLNLVSRHQFASLRLFPLFISRNCVAKEHCKPSTFGETEASCFLAFPFSLSLSLPRSIAVRMFLKCMPMQQQPSFSGVKTQCHHYRRNASTKWSRSICAVVISRRVFIGRLYY